MFGDEAGLRGEISGGDAIVVIRVGVWAKGGEVAGEDYPDDAEDLADAGFV